MRLAWLGVLLLVGWIGGCGPPAEQSGREVQRLAGSASNDAAPCECWKNLYDCADFATSRSAQDCYLHCRELGNGDVHRLDRDSDGRACEWNAGGY